MTAILQGVGTIFQAKGQIDAGNAEYAAAKINAAAQSAQGTQQRNISIGEAQDKGRAAELRAGQIRAAYGAAGIDAGSGTPLEVMSDQATQGELTRQLTLWQGKAQQQSADTQASIDIAQGRAAQRAGYTSAMATMFNGAASILQSSGGSAASAGKA